MRNFVFGVEDGLVSTVGLLSGIEAAGNESRTIFVTGMVLIVVEALSMAIGSFLSENSAEEFSERKEEPLAHSLPNAFIMFFSYFLTGFIPLFPYLLLPASQALWVSIAASLVALGILGAISGKMAHTSTSKGILKMVLLGGAAIGVGIGVGSLL